ncbi:serine hydrolase domain-containing protein [Saccharopolyspora tripterygii]
MSLRGKRFVVLLAVVAAAAGGATATAQPGRPETRCAAPDGDSAATRVEPGAVDLDPAAVRDALTYANTHLRASVQVFRHDCLVGTGALDPVTQNVPVNVWSSTKSVVSLLTGIARDRGQLQLDDPIDRYLPQGPGWGDAAHRAITVRQLLTQTSGIRQAIASEAATTGTDVDIAREALAQPLVREPGSAFEYSQRGVDLLAFVVQRAVGRDLQEFAQEALFAPVGIAAHDYVWLRDRSGNTYGYAHLFIPPERFARLGLLMAHDGEWNGTRVVSADYVSQLRQPTATNGCYGFLFWTNAGKPCTSANVPHAQTVDRQMITSAPADLYAMVGAFHQNNFVIPSLGIVVTWTGLLGDTAPNAAGIASSLPADLYHNFFRILLRGIRDQHVPDPGPYQNPPFDFDFNPINYADPRVLLTDLAPHPQCNVLVCDGTVPLRGLAQNGEAVLGSVLGR